MINPGLKDTVAASALPLGASTSANQQSELNLFTDSARFDAFSRLRISNPETVFSVSCQYGRAIIQMESFNTGTGVSPLWDANTRLVALSGTAGIGTSGMQSFQYSPYQPGKSHLIAVTGTLGTAVSGWKKEIGYFDSLNGIFYRQNETGGLEIVRRTSTTGGLAEEVITQANWNQDKLEGTGTSGFTLDVTKCFILIIDLQFLGMGRVRVGFDINGIIVYGHYFNNANNLTGTYMQSGTLPIQALLTGTSTGSPATMYFKCATVQSEGGYLRDNGYQFSTPEGTATAGSGTRTHLISVRPKATYNGIPNRELFVLDKVNSMVTGNNPVFWELMIGATFSVAPTWADVNTTYSAYEYATGGTYSGTNGLVLASGYLTASGGVGNTLISQISAQVNMHYPISLNRAGAVRDNGTLTLVVTGVGGTSACRGTIEYIEIR